MNEQAKDLLIQSQRKEIEGLGNQIQELKEEKEQRRGPMSLAGIVGLDCEDHAIVHGDPGNIQGQAKETILKTAHQNRNALECLMFGIPAIGKLMWHAGERGDKTTGDENNILFGVGAFLESLGEMLFAIHQVEAEIEYGLKRRLEWEREQAKGGAR